MSNHNGMPQGDDFHSASDQKFEQFVRSIADGAIEEIPCDECRRYFPLLYDIEKRGRDVSTEANVALAHLRRCRECALEYHLLRAAMAEYEAGTLPELDHAPKFDLSFLNSEPARQPLWISDLANQLQTFCYEVVVKVQANLASFEVLPPPIAPTRMAAGLFRSLLMEGQMEVLMLPAADANLSVQLAVCAVPDGKAAIAVRLLSMEKTEPLPNTRVTLRNGQRQLLAGSVTEKDGSILFEQLSPGRYFVQVRYEQQNWEVPLIIVESNRFVTGGATTE